MVEMPSARNLPCSALPTPQIRFTGNPGEVCLRVAATQDRETARLVQVRGQFGERLVVAEPNRCGDAAFRFYALEEIVEGRRRLALCRRSVPDRSRNASSIDIGSTAG